MFKTKQRKKQKGQSLIYVGLLVIVIISGVFFVYDIGNIVNTKIKFQNGVDSAVLASVSVKISKHHTETLVRAGMYNESIAAQAQQRAAQARLVIVLDQIQKRIDSAPQIITPIQPPNTPPNSPIEPIPHNGNGPQPVQVEQGDKTMADKYRESVNSAYRHVTKLHRETRALQAYYDWLSGVTSDSSKKGAGRKAITEAARIGFRGNTLGLFDIAENADILSEEEDIFENNPKAPFTPISSVAYKGESPSKTGTFGKSYIEVNGFGKRSSQGVSLLKYADKYLLRTTASAKIASSKDLGLKDASLSEIPLIGLEFLWYSPRLMAIEQHGEKWVVH